MPCKGKIANFDSLALAGPVLRQAVNVGGNFGHFRILTKHTSVKKEFGFVVLILLFSCSSSYKYEYWNISRFNLVPDALADNEEVKLIYSSQAPDNNEQLEYYIQVVVISQKSGDTVNVLTTINNGFSNNDGGKTYNYISPESPMMKVLQMDLNNLKDYKNEIEKVSQSKLKRIDKVARDPKFDFIADNKYPTVIGAIGIFTQNNEQ